MREVARLMKANAGHVNTQMQGLNTAGMIWWTRLAGSVQLTPAGRKFLKANPAGPPPKPRRLVRNPRRLAES